MSRSRFVALAVTGVAAVVITSWFSLWLRATPAQTRTADYTATYVAGTAFRHGLGAELYDTHAQSRQAAALGLGGAQFSGEPFVDPPLVAALAAPLSLLALDASFRLWSLLQLAMVIAAVVVAVRAAPWPAATPAAVRVAAVAVGVAGAGTAVLFLQGQVDGFSALGLAVAYACWKNDRRAAGGVALAAGMLLAKPHLALLLAVWLLGRRDRRMLAGAAAGVAALTGATIAVVGPAGLASWVHAPFLTTSVTPVRMLLGLLGLSASWLGDAPVAYALAGVATLGAVVAAARLGAWTRRDPMTLDVSLACAAVLSLLAAPHMLTQDLAVLSVPLAVCLARAAAADGIAASPGPRTFALLAGWVLLDLAARADIGNYSPAPPGRLVPVVLIGTLVAGFVIAHLARRGAAAVSVRSPAAAR
ncbi:MAG: glycosyltransferase 87 family protein [Candidatus Dormibacteria bacterium]